jgi:hypothetical protein
MIAIVLWLLASVDAAFCGYRAAAGRSLLIRKGAYFREAMRRGWIWGQVAVGASSAALLLALATASDAHRLAQDLKAMAARMAVVYVPYALVIGVALALRSVPSVDVRSLTSTLVFGPLTLARPLVLLAGLAFAVASRPSLTAALLAAIVGGLMLGLEPLLGRAYAANDRARSA